SVETVGAPPGPRPVDSIKLLASPNPFFGGSNIDFSLARADQIDLAVYDLSGRRVKTIKRGTIAAGPHRFEWNGRDEGGRRSAPGVYFVRLETERIELK